MSVGLFISLKTRCQPCDHVGNIVLDQFRWTLLSQTRSLKAAAGDRYLSHELTIYTSVKPQKLHKIKGQEPGRSKKKKTNRNLPRSLNISIYKVVAMVTGHIHGQWSRFTQRIKAQSYHLSGSQSLKVESRAAQRSIPKFCTADSISSSNSEDLTMTARKKQHSSSEGQGVGKRSRAAFLNRWITNRRNVLFWCLFRGNCIKRVKS